MVTTSESVKSGAMSEKRSHSPSICHHLCFQSMRVALKLRYTLGHNFFMYDLSRTAVYVDTAHSCVRDSMIHIVIT